MKDSAFSQSLHLMRNASASKAIQICIIIIIIGQGKGRVRNEAQYLSDQSVYSYFDSSQNNEHFSLQF